ncbi:MAG TPA: DMT family transporter [Gaiellaceae bacterium]|nr:DMT family transporter [Gaiellaceae bacterium]
MSWSGAAAVAALAAGILGALQVAVMGRYGARIGTLEALAFTAALGALLAAVVLLVSRRSLSGYADAVSVPKWLWLGAVFGIFIVGAITLAGAKIGATATVALLIAGQLGTAVVVDRFGWFGIEKVAVSWPRVAGVALLAVGAFLTLRR